MHKLSDEVLCARWPGNPDCQFFCGELSFCHRLPFDRWSLPHWRQRVGEAQPVALVQESLAVAHKTGALGARNRARVGVDTMVQPKAIAHPTDARRCHRALEKRAGLAKRNDVPLRPSHRRVAKRAAVTAGRYTHAHQFKRARRERKFRRPRLGRVIRDISRKIAGHPALGERFAALLGRAVRVRLQDHRQRGPKSLPSGRDPRVCALHAAAVKCIGQSLPRQRPGGAPRHPPDPPRNETPRRDRAGHWHLKAEHQMERNYLKGRAGDRANAVPAAAGYNLALLLR